MTNLSPDGKLTLDDLIAFLGGVLERDHLLRSG